MRGNVVISNEQRATLDALEGLISSEVGMALAVLASSVPANHVIVEVGCYKGKSTSYLASGAMAGGGARVYAVDPWDTPGNAGGRFGFDQEKVRHAFHRQLAQAGVTQQVTPVQAFSVDAAKRYVGPPIGLLYIDGSHTEADVLADWRAWSRELAPCGIVAFDDYNTPRNPGVKKIVDRIRQ
jgi:predicted O-methyltransferase YrrM